MTTKYEELCDEMLECIGNLVISIMPFLSPTGCSAVCAMPRGT